MRAPCVERLTRFFGVALLVTAGFSTGLRHAHPGGPYEHDHDHEIHVASDTSADAWPMASWEAAPMHMHVFVLGFQFTLPAEDSGDSESAPQGFHAVVVRLIDDNLSDSATRVPTSIASVPPLGLPAALVLEDVRPRVPSSPDTHGVPLCDAARHERSGVLRA